MFLGQMDKPDVDEITGLSPAISIDQKTTSHNPRSTVGTVTEIYDYLRLLYARIGVPALPGVRPGHQPADRGRDGGCRAQAAGGHPVPGAGPCGARAQGHAAEGAGCRPAGRLLPVCGSTAIMYDLDEEITLEKNIKHTVEIVVDRLAMQQGHPQAVWRIRWKLRSALTGGIAEHRCHRRRVR